MKKVILLDAEPEKVTLEEAARDNGMQGRVVWAIANCGVSNPMIRSVYRRCHSFEEWEDPKQRISKEDFTVAVNALVSQGFIEPASRDRIRFKLHSPDAVFAVKCCGLLECGGKCSASAEPRRGKVAAHAQARAEGWSVQSASAYCPSCAARRNPLVPFIPEKSRKARRADRRRKG